MVRDVQGARAEQLHADDVAYSSRSAVGVRVHSVVAADGSDEVAEKTLRMVH